MRHFLALTVVVALAAAGAVAQSPRPNLTGTVIAVNQQSASVTSISSNGICAKQVNLRHGRFAPPKVAMPCWFRSRTTRATHGTTR